MSPSRGELARLATPLNPGEHRFLEFLDAHLPSDWEIYVQPHMNNLRPDFVLLHPRVGVAVYEVKDWDLAAMDWQTALDRRGATAITGVNNNGARVWKQHPLTRLRQYRDEIAGLYCPRLGEQYGMAAITAGIVVPGAPEAEVRERLSLTDTNGEARYLVGVGRDTLEGGHIDRVLPDYARTGSWHMTPDTAADLRHWLVEPDVSAEQRERPALSAEQRHLASTRTELGYRRLRGPAGSGKTMVLAARAAELANDGKDVLVVSYNLTLLNYLRDSATRFGCPRNRVTWFNFHSWCKRVMFEAGMGAEYNALWHEPSGSVLDHVLPDAVADAVDSGAPLATYDAILVDEGQNMRPNWWNALRKALRANGEMLLVADRAQDVYGRNGLWTEGAMEGAGFRGPWATLEPTYRLPLRLTRLMAEFVERFLKDADISVPQPPQGELDVDVAKLNWRQTTVAELAPAALEAVSRLLIDSPTNPSSTAAFADVVVLVDTKELGREIEHLLESKNIRVLSTFAEDQRKERQQKVYFFKGDARVKATTFHSFQGWEGRCIVVAISHASSERALHGVYTALTRLKAHPNGSFMQVVCAAPELGAFGHQWD